MAFIENKLESMKGFMLSFYTNKNFLFPFCINKLFCDGTGCSTNISILFLVSPDEAMFDYLIIFGKLFGRFRELFIRFYYITSDISSKSNLIQLLWKKRAFQT